MSRLHLLGAAALSVLAISAPRAGVITSLASPPDSRVALARVPDDGLQPQVAVDGSGRIHLVYYRGPESGGDLFYTSAGADGKFSPAIRVNTQRGSAVSIGTMRGAHLALGRNGRVHVGWYGSSSAAPRAPGGATPILYARLNPATGTFEPQRNVVQYAVGLDGGSLAADAAGHVYVAWHAAGPTGKGEGTARLWVAQSNDDGATFSREDAASAPEIGACGCCGVGAVADATGAYVLFRSARDVVHRDTYLLHAAPGQAAFTSTPVDEWNIGACPMSTFALASTASGVYAAWETAGSVRFTRLDASGRPTTIVRAPAGASGQKYPALAVNPNGDVLLAWTEGTGWQRGGDVAWQVYDRNGAPTTDRGRHSGVPVWSLVAAYAAPDGTFRILY